MEFLCIEQRKRFRRLWQGGNLLNAFRSKRNAPILQFLQGQAEGQIPSRGSAQISCRFRKGMVRPAELCSSSFSQRPLAKYLELSPRIPYFF
jgi:hypothetical protein